MMRKIAVIFVVAFSLGLFLSSCSSNQSVAAPIATSTVWETLIPSQVFHPTPEFTPTVNITLNKSSGLIATLGEKVNRQGWWPAIPAFSPDGKMIALVSEKVMLWDAETYKLIHEFVKPYSNHNTYNVAFSSDGSLLAASICCAESSRTGRVLIWDTERGILLHDWEQQPSKNTSKIEEVPNSSPATGLAFLPGGSVLAFANGNTVEIRDIQNGNESTVLELSDKMVAHNIAISGDGKRLFAFMDFLYDKTPTEIGNELGKKYTLQTWDLESKKLVDNIEFSEPGNTVVYPGHFDVVMKLSGKVLLNLDYKNQVFTATELETGETRNLYYRGEVETYISQDANYVIYLPDFDGFNCKNQSIELWDTKVNQNLYVFKTSNKDFDTEWCYGPNTIIFSPDNTILAIAHEQRVSLWNVSSFTKPEGNSTP